MIIIIIYNQLLNNDNTRNIMRIIIMVVCDIMYQYNIMDSYLPMYNV